MMTTTTSTKTTSAGCLKKNDGRQIHRVKATIEKLVSNDTRCAERSWFINEDISYPAMMMTTRISFSYTSNTHSRYLSEGNNEKYFSSFFKTIKTIADRFSSSDWSIGKKRIFASVTFSIPSFYLGSTHVLTQNKRKKILPNCFWCDVNQIHPIQTKFSLVQ